ncbi:kelch repeat-containing protein [Cupriavidus sp. AU9028]|uniref:putative Ig domain-containing protein n=1 Tax=Cupriavidus sp. AU9028 TaxID=2871157 RepID=UPI001C93A973|nr:kelch repeat-containing protein [Cupriavidus sp. AU9028]MBY4898939.1 putative Ig domain-containing protein [Cupriavidus sp. AU9028]
MIASAISATQQRWRDSFVPGPSWIAILLLCLASLLTACGDGGDGGDEAVVTEPPAGLSYAMTSAVYETEEPIVPNRPSASGGAAERYTVAPSLPAGLVLDPLTGVITGTPAAVSPATIYTVTAENAGGSATARVQIEVRNTPAAPAGLAYREPAVTYTVGEAIAANAPTSSGGPISAYSIAPALPAGLAFDTQTGAITGIPTAVSAEADYTVTGSNAAGDTTATLRIAVQAAVVAPASLSYSTPAALYVAAEAIIPNTPVLSGGAAAEFSISPALPPGLSLNTETGVIAGTPTTVQGQALYTVIARNRAGSAQTQVAIAVTSRGSWTAAAPLLVPMHYSSATTLAGGKVLLAGGYTASGITNACAIYDPLANSWTATGSLATGRSEGTATRLPNGRVLVAGGSTGGTVGTATAELYDPVTGMWQATASMAEARIRHTATLLRNGKVLVIGGYTRSGGTVHVSGTAELYDPATGTWSALTTRLAEPRGQHSATLLADGSAVLVVGGGGNGFASSSELFPVGDSGLTTPVAGGGQATVSQAVRLASGKVLAIGEDATARLYDPATSSWTTSTMNAQRLLPTMTLLPDGRVLVAGGAAVGGRLASTEIYNPDANTWTVGASMSTPRGAAMEALLSDGSVLVIGGFNESGEVWGVERFRP